MVCYGKEMLVKGLDVHVFGEMACAVSGTDLGSMMIKPVSADEVGESADLPHVLNNGRLSDAV